MSRRITSSDRKRLIRLASSLPKGSEERRAILAGLKVGAEEWEGKDGDRVEVQLDPYRGPTLWKGKVTVSEAKKMDAHLGTLHQADEEGELRKFSELDARTRTLEQEIKFIQQEKKRLEKKLGPALDWAKKMKIWGHYATGGSTMITVAFQDSDGDWHQIIEGEVE